MPLVLAQISSFFTFWPLAAAGAGAVAIPIIIHLLSRLRRRPQAWGAMRFLLEAYRRHRRRLQIEQLLLLLVRCLIFLALGLALAGPLLGGCARKAGFGAAGRLVYLVLDDSLSSQVTTGDQHSRFEQLKTTAAAMADDLSPNDRVAVWLAGRPARNLVAAGPPDPARLARQLEALRPRFGRSDLFEALKQVSDDIAETARPADQVFVAVLSDFAYDSLARVQVDDPAAELADLGERAVTLLARPRTAVSNVQIGALSLRRQTALVPEDAAVTIPLTVTLRRFAVDDPRQLTGVAVELIGPGAPTVTARRQHRWLAGQTEAAVAMDLAVSGRDVPIGPGGLPLIVRGSIEPDALRPDDERFSVVRLRRQFNVALIDAAGVPGPVADGAAFDPARWMKLALTPGSPDAGDLPGALAVKTLTADVIDARSLAGVDAAMVLRPDLLTPAGWLALRDLADAGGLVWVFVPPIATPMNWTAALRKHLGATWQLGMEPITPEDDDEQAAWSLRTDQPTPEPLRLLSAEWPDLLRPIEVRRRLALQVSAGSDPVWLATSDGGPLMVSTPVGDGALLLLATAVNSQWTNLPTKPLFVPLLHEALRSVLGRSRQAARLAMVVCGDRPVLGPGWAGAQRIKAPDGSTIALEPAGDAVAPATVLEQPGAYRAEPDVPVRLAVNVDAAGGDTRATDPEVLADWFKRVGPMKWLDPQRPAAALVIEPPRANIGWWLLWAVLALVLAETALARVFSHGRIGGTSLFQSIIRAIRGGGR